MDDAQPPVLREGPWLIWTTGTWGTGRHSKCEVEDGGVFNLARPPEDDEPIPEGESSAYVPPMEEAIEPELGLEVRFGDQVISPRADGSEFGVRNATE